MSHGLPTSHTREPDELATAVGIRAETVVIPEDWGVRSLSSMLAQPPSYGINAPAVPFEGSLPTYIRITDIADDGRFRPTPRVSVSAPDATRFFLRPGDLVFARTGASVGKSYLYDQRDGPLVLLDSSYASRQIQGGCYRHTSPIMRRPDVTGIGSRRTPRGADNRVSIPESTVLYLSHSPPPRAAGHRRRPHGRGRPGRVAGGADRQEAGNQASGDAATPDRQDAATGVRWGVGDASGWRIRGLRRGWYAHYIPTGVLEWDGQMDELWRASPEDR